MVVSVVAESNLAATPLLALILMPLLMIEYVICCQRALLYMVLVGGRVSTFSVMTKREDAVQSENNNTRLVSISHVSGASLTSYRYKARGNDEREIFDVPTYRVVRSLINYIKLVYYVIILRAFTIDNGRPVFFIFRLGDPHFMKGT